jgi:hypothetical protein
MYIPDVLFYVFLLDILGRREGGGGRGGSGRYHFNVIGSSGQEPVHVLLYSYLPRSTHAVGAAVGQPDVASQQRTLPAVVGAIVVVVEANAVSVRTWVWVIVVENVWVWVCVEVEFPIVSTDNDVDIDEDTATDKDRDVYIDVEVEAVVVGIAVSKTQVLLAEHPHGLSSIEPCQPDGF